MMKRFSDYSLSTYLRCPRKFYYKYIEKVKIEKKSLSISMIFGNIIHNACKDLYILKIEDRTIDNLQKIFRQYWKKSPIRKLFNNLEEERQIGLRGLVMLENFYKSFGTKTPFQIEGYVEYKVGEYVLFGRIDRIDAEEDGSLSIVDYKTGSYNEESDELERELKTVQIRLYAVLLYGNHRIVNNGSFYYFHDNFFDMIEFTEEKIKYDTSFFHEVITDIQFNRDFIIQPSFHCKFCDFFDICQKSDVKMEYLENPTKKFDENF